MRDSFRPVRPMSTASILVYMMEAVIVALQHLGPESWDAQSESV